jgi:hypothetical protein
MAMSLDMSAKTTPMGPYFLSPDIIVLEKVREKTTSIPNQHTAVAMAEGKRILQGILLLTGAIVKTTRTR